MVVRYARTSTRRNRERWPPWFAFILAILRHLLYRGDVYGDGSVIERIREYNSFVTNPPTPLFCNASPYQVVGDLSTSV